MDKWARLSADQRENLVAYLDGELEDNLTQQIDKVLVQSEVARHEVEALARTWELLDLLPRPAARDDFTERTLTTLKVSEVRTRLVDQPWFAYVRKGSLGLIWLAGLALCAIVGYTATTQWVPNPQEELLTSLPLLRNLDTYLEVRDLDFVLDLQRAQVFNVADTEDSQPNPRPLDIPKPQPMTQALLQERYEQVARMPASERQRIQYNWSTFQQLPPAQQQEIHELHAQLKEQPETIHALLQTYALWLQTLTPGQRDDLRQADSSAKRLQLVRQFKEKQDASRDTQLFDLNLDLQRMKPRLPPGPSLSDEDFAAVMDVLQSTLSAPDQFAARSKSGLDRYMEIYRHVFPRERMPVLTEETVNRIMEAIQDEEYHRFSQNRTVEQNRVSLYFLITRVLRAQVYAELDPFFPTKEQLQEFFAKGITSERREQLLELSSQDLTRALLNEYFEKTEVDNPRLKTLREYAARMRPPEGFWGGDRPFPSWRGRGSGDRPGERPPGERPPGDDRGRGDRPRPEGMRSPPPGPPPERKLDAPNF